MAPDTASFVFSSLSLGLSIGTLVWHNRKTDSVLCTLVACEPKHQLTQPATSASVLLAADFQFSFGNLGTRPVLLRDVRVMVFGKPELNGLLSDDCVLDDKLPRVIQPGEMCSVTLQLSWTLDFMQRATEEAKQRGENWPSLFFVARCVLWNPKGIRMLAEQPIARFQGEHQGWKFEVYPKRTFRAKKLKDRTSSPEVTTQRRGWAEGS